MNRRRVASTLSIVVGLGLVAATSAFAATVQRTISGPITSVKGSTFTVSTNLVKTGKARVTVGSKTTITEQQSGSKSDLKTGVCVIATGTKKGTAIRASRVSISASCTRPGGNRPPGGTPPNGGGGSTPPRTSASHDQHDQQGQRLEADGEEPAGLDHGRDRLEDADHEDREGRRSP